MHLDARGYAYESFREGGRVCRRYVGSGEWIGAVLWLDERDRQERAEKRVEARAQIERAASGTDELKALCAASDKAFRAAMKASGFHRIKRGPWRKARALQARNPMAKTKTTETLSPKVAALEPKERETSDLMKCAQNGDYNAAQELMKLMKGDPNECEFMALCVPFVRRAREALVGLKSNNELAKAALDRHMDLMRDELAGPNPSPLERMLAERVVLCFYQVEILSAFLMEMQRESLSRTVAT